MFNGAGKLHPDKITGNPTDMPAFLLKSKKSHSNETAKESTMTCCCVRGKMCSECLVRELMQRDESTDVNRLNFPVLRQFRIQFRHESRGMVGYCEEEYDIYFERQFIGCEALIGDEKSRGGRSIDGMVKHLMSRSRQSKLDVVHCSSFVMLVEDDMYGVIKNRYNGTRDSVVSIDEKVCGLWTRRLLMPAKMRDRNLM